VFLDNELARYRDQIAAYTRLFALMEERPVRAAHYFPFSAVGENWKGLQPIEKRFRR